MNLLMILGEIIFKVIKAFFIGMTFASIILGIYIIFNMPTLEAIVSTILSTFLSYSIWQIIEDTETAKIDER